MQKIESHKLYHGEIQVWQHDSKATNTPMKFAIYLPPNALNTEKSAEKFPVLYWLSGLTCTEQNFIQKSGFAEFASQHNIIVVAPDTSPRSAENGQNVPNDDSYDLGQGASFYVNATQAPWATHFQMYDYIVDELPELIEKKFPTSDKRSIFGHSMGGHGALMVALKNAERYQSVSAFSPITNPSQVPWGKKTFSAYLGENIERWQDYDSTELVKKLGCNLPIRIEQGLADEFLANQLEPTAFIAACKVKNVNLDYREQDGYDHSYYFITSFINEHFAFHAQYLR